MGFLTQRLFDTLNRLPILNWRKIGKARSLCLCALSTLATQHVLVHFAVPPRLRNESSGVACPARSWG